MKRRLGDRAEILYYMDDLKASMRDVETAQAVHETVKKYAMSVGIVIYNKKSAIQLNVETPLPESLQEIPRLDEVAYKYLGFEMKKGDVERREVMKKLEQRIRDFGTSNKESRGVRSKKLDPLHQPERDECGPVLQRAGQVHPRVA